MKVKREINSIPKRSAMETWNTIVGLVTGPGSVDKADLDAIAGIVGTIITDETPKGSPFVFHGSGPRLVVYCQFGSDAMDQENIDALNWNPTEDVDWHLAVPCRKEDFDWITNAIAKKTSRVTVYDAAVGYEEDEAEETAKSAEFTVNFNLGA